MMPSLTTCAIACAPQASQQLESLEYTEQAYQQTPFQQSALCQYAPQHLTWPGRSH